MATTTKASAPAEVDEVIELSQVEKSRRGRTAQIDADLVELFRNLENGKAVRLRAKFGEVPNDGKRQGVSQKIRTAWKAANGPDSKCTINYSQDGVPQVSHKVAKAAS